MHEAKTTKEKVQWE